MWSTGYLATVRRRTPQDTPSALAMQAPSFSICIEICSSRAGLLSFLMRNYVAVSCLVLLGSFLPARGQSPPASISSCAAKLLRPAESLKSEGVFADQNIDVGYYRLDLTLQPASSSLRGSVLVRCTSLVDSLTQISLDLNGGMKVDSVTSGSARLSFSQYPLGLIVTLDRTYRRGEMVTLVVVYGGLPAATGYGSFEFASQGSSPWIWSLSEPTGAPDWWPCKDTPTDKPDSVDIVVTCPSPLKVGSNGSLVEVRDNGNGTLTYHWAERYPIATYLVSLAVADYVVLTDWFHYSPTDSMVILNYVLPTSLVAAIQPLGFVPSMLQFFSDKYGLYPFIREKYGHAQFGWGGAMEHQTMTSTSNFTEGTLAHELAHHWFGDMITCANWPSLWLNEGFATYSEALWQEWRHGEAVYRADMRDMMPNAKAAIGTLYVQDTSTVATLFAYDRVYAKGAWVLQMLRHVLGDSTFFRTMRAYADDPRFRFKSATTEGVQKRRERRWDGSSRSGCLARGTRITSFHGKLRRSPTGSTSPSRCARKTPGVIPRSSRCPWTSPSPLRSGIRRSSLSIPSTANRFTTFSPSGRRTCHLTPACGSSGRHQSTAGGSPFRSRLTRTFPIPSIRGQPSPTIWRNGRASRSPSTTFSAAPSQRWHTAHRNPAHTPSNGMERTTPAGVRHPESISAV